MKRRGFLGFIGGAAVAGPQVAKNVIKTMPSGIGPQLGLVGGYAGNTVSAAKDGYSGSISKDWRLDEIERLRRFISGEETDAEREEKRQQRLHLLEPIVSQNVMGLRSVSPGTQVRMHRKRMEAVNREAEVIYSKLRLNEYLKELGLWTSPQRHSTSPPTSTM